MYVFLICSIHKVSVDLVFVTRSDIGWSRECARKIHSLIVLTEADESCQINNKYVAFTLICIIWNASTIANT